MQKKLESRIKPPGFTGKAPGAPSRWSSGQETPWQPLKPNLVVEVVYDQVTNERFRHGTTFLRWRPEKKPRDCTFEQLQAEANPRIIARLLSGQDETAFPRQRAVPTSPRATVPTRRASAKSS